MKPNGKKPQKNPRFNGAAIEPGNRGNSGGKPGRSGRKTLAFAEECNRLVDDVVLPKIDMYLMGHAADDPAWRWCAEFASKYTKSEPPKKQVVTGDAELPIVFKLDLGAASLARLHE